MVLNIGELMATASESSAARWKKSGMFKGIGIPVPSGQHQVGCVDVMPLCKGDDTDSGLLFRLYYPTEATPDSEYHYPPWLPDSCYAKGYILQSMRLPSLVAGAVGSLASVLCGEYKSLYDVHKLDEHRTEHSSTLWSTSEDIYSTTCDSVLAWSGRNANYLLGCLL